MSAEIRPLSGNMADSGVRCMCFCITGIIYVLYT